MYISATVTAVAARYIYSFRSLRINRERLNYKIPKYSEITYNIMNLCFKRSQMVHDTLQIASSQMY